MHTRRLAAVVLPLVLVLTLPGGDGGRAANVPEPISTEMVLSRIEPDELTRYLHKIIQEELKRPAPDDRAVFKVRAMTLLIAAQAQNGRGARDLWQRTALRDNALKLVKDLPDGKIDLEAARKHAASLFDMGSGSADPRRVDLKPLAEHDDVKILFRPRRMGGIGFGPGPPAGNFRDGIEFKLLMLAKKQLAGPDLNAEAEHIARAASVTAAMANLIEGYAPARKIGGKDPKAYKDLTGQMRTAAQDLEAAAKARDAKGIRAAALRLTTSCNDCHGVFRD